MITINNKEYKFKFTLRAMMLFEQITQRTFAINNLTDEYLYIYCLVMANNPNADMTFEDLIDAMDNDPAILEKFKEELEIYTKKQSMYLDTENVKKKD